MLEQILIALATVFFPPLLILVLLVVLLATFGKSLGVRRFIVATLLRVFEWARAELRESATAGKRNSIAVSASRTIIDRSPLTDQAQTDNDDGLTDDEMPPNMEKNNLIQKLNRSDSAGVGQTMVGALVDDNFDFLLSGMESIIEDQVTSRFLTEELATWNLLSRTGIKYQHFSWRLGGLWLGGLIIRYCFLFPIRLLLLVIGLVFLISTTAVIGYVPNEGMRKWLNWHANIISYRICSRAVSAIITFHDIENAALPGGICVANHTSPIDVMLLACDNCYALIGQSHSGLLGVIQRALNRASKHIWFERSEAADRMAVSKRIREHVSDKRNLPILIFPEGTCINNTSVMQFKKGSFEVGVPIYPVAIKYDPRFGDPFWNSSEQSWTQYIVAMMTSWAIVADVWYLPAETQNPGENAIEFAARVKKVIANKGGLVDLEWDGQLKRQRAPEKLRAHQQKLYSQRLGRMKKPSISLAAWSQDDVLDHIVDSKKSEPVQMKLQNGTGPGPVGTIHERELEKTAAKDMNANHQSDHSKLD